MQSSYALLADCIVVLHFFYVFFAVGGEIVIIVGYCLKWSWIRNLVFRIIHLASVVLVAVDASIGVLCPLTVWEYKLRQLAGQTVEKNISFIARLVRMIIFYDLPSWVFTLIYISFGCLVILTFIFILPRSHREKA
ncbi:MAG: DUF2784 domain-containing protein [Proteobacteria bacterium]|nr:DUF2784 domain-containing protein [Pseudomonadota bacterium]